VRQFSAFSAQMGMLHVAAFAERQLQTSFRRGQADANTHRPRSQAHVEEGKTHPHFTHTAVVGAFPPPPDFTKGF